MSQNYALNKTLTGKYSWFNVFNYINLCCTFLYFAMRIQGVANYS